MSNVWVALFAGVPIENAAIKFVIQKFKMLTKQTVCYELLLHEIDEQEKTHIEWK